MKTIMHLLIIGILGFAVHCKQETKTADNNTGETKKIVKNSDGKKGTLLFFMNPDGRPCQIQDSILTEISSEITKQVNVQYVKTTNPDDRQTFYDYTVRALPFLVIVDNDFKEIKRFSPGIQKKETILQAIKAL